MLRPSLPGCSLVMQPSNLMKSAQASVSVHNSVFFQADENFIYFENTVRARWMGLHICSVQCPIHMETPTIRCSFVYSCSVWWRQDLSILQGIFHTLSYFYCSNFLYFLGDSKVRIYIREGVLSFSERDILSDPCFFLSIQNPLLAMSFFPAANCSATNSSLACLADSQEQPLSKTSSVWYVLAATCNKLSVQQLISSSPRWLEEIEFPLQIFISIGCLQWQLEIELWGHRVKWLTI